MASHYAKVPPHVNSSPSVAMLQSRRHLFGDCALVEIIHLHDCLRGAIVALQHDTNKLRQSLEKDRCVDDNINKLERKIAGRFKLIWSVFQAHSAAEDEFIWPALQSKQDATRRASDSQDIIYAADANNREGANGVADGGTGPVVIEQEAYEEDHADEERMFSLIDSLLSQLRNTISNETKSEPTDSTTTGSVVELAKAIDDHILSLSQHLMNHLDKEETQCMPLVSKHMSKSEINELVGKIMGKRSSDTITNIMTMAVQNLDDDERKEMIHYMKEAMLGTFFERWLIMGGFMSSTKDGEPASDTLSDDRKPPANDSSTRKRAADDTLDEIGEKRPKPDQDGMVQTTDNCDRQTQARAGSIDGPSAPAEVEIDDLKPAASGVTTQAELEKLIRAIASNPGLTSAQKNTTIQGLRDSVWKSNLKQKLGVPGQQGVGGASMASSGKAIHQPTTATRSMRVTPPNFYFKANPEGKVELVWSSDSASATVPPDNKKIPLFSAAELAPTYHNGAAGTVLGCPHYARACKLRHPKSGRLYTCRLCCEQEREMPLRDQDSPLDRYTVSEILCMRCGTLQPTSDHCVNPLCESRGKSFAKWFCSICKLYDDSPTKDIYHCPFCNTCRTGKGLGIDYRHCMRCNACVSLADDEHHCIPQRLQAACPICHESMFESTEPLRGLKCGHVMHLSCFNMYMRGHSYTCPLCKKSVDDMKDYFSLLDSAIRMQPMPPAYASTVSSIYCQDCGQNAQVQYHFVGCKCPHCGSYNTRELGRVQGH